ncbi:MAG: OmpA family protein [Clostridiales bacterium]|jgi:chemotaxis protein MotB|nr:OmpA family protein [Clostridiales bacterium]
MRAITRGRRQITKGDGGSHWISFSDMLSSLLLVFILALMVSIYQYFSVLDVKTRELETQRVELDRTQLSLVQKEEDLKTAQAELMGKEEEVASIQIQLQQQEDELKAAQTALKTQKDEQAVLQLQLLAQETSLNEMQLAMNAQQRQIDDLLGVRTQIIADLSQAFAQSNLNVKVNEDTGDIMLDSSLLFQSGGDILLPAGQMQLAQLIPVYLSVLMRPEYDNYVAEIVIEGHTDSKGSYLFNLQLSQDRALGVATYMLELPNLTPAQRSKLQAILTAKGRSYSDRVFYPDGSENMDASRRVEIQFRLKDSEMIQKMNEILLQGR